MTLRARESPGPPAALFAPYGIRAPLAAAAPLKTSLCQQGSPGVILALLMGNRPDIYLIIRISFGLIRA